MRFSEGTGPDNQIPGPEMGFRQRQDGEQMTTQKLPVPLQVTPYSEVPIDTFVPTRG